jgi:hypothetical protein
MPDGTRNPYPGPRPFRAEEYRIFAGRDDEIADLSSLIIAHSAVLLYAQSSAGKTSLLHAGLAPGMESVGLDQAIIHGALTRLWPVLMTALVASFGFVPMATEPRCSDRSPPR